MNKVLSSIGIGSLTFILLLGLSFTSVSASHVQPSESGLSQSIDPQSTYTQYIEITLTNLTIPKLTYEYNRSGYTGTLSRVDYERQSNGTYTVDYAGYIYCTGLCPTTQLDE